MVTAMTVPAAVSAMRSPSSTRRNRRRSSPRRWANSRTPSVAMPTSVTACTTSSRLSTVWKRPYWSVPRWRVTRTTPPSEQSTPKTKPATRTRPPRTTTEPASGESRMSPCSSVGSVSAAGMRPRMVGPGGGWPAGRPAPFPCPADAQVRTHHRDHRPGRLLPRRAAAREGLRRPRHGPPLLDGEVRAHRAPARAGDAPPGRSARRALPDRRDARSRPGRGLQPRRDVVRGGVVDPADADGRVHRRRRDPDARGDARRLPRRPLLPGVLERDVRQGARDAAERGDAVLPALALRRGEGLRAPHHGQLPRVL